MQYLKTAAALALALAFSAGAGAQGADKKLALARQVIAAQQGPELDRLVQQLTAAAVQPEAVRWQQRIEALVPKEQQQKVFTDVDAELKKFGADARKIIQDRLKKANDETLAAAYAEKFSEEELQQLATYFNSPLIKKYQELAPQIANQVVSKVIETSKPPIVERAKTFNAAAAKIVGAGSAAPAGQPAASGTPRK